MLLKIRNALLLICIWGPLALSLGACSTVSKSSGGAGGSSSGVVGENGQPTEGDLADNGSDLEALPLEVNKNVLQWIDYFQGRGRPHMERYLQRSTRYMPIMKKILKENGLPEDLIYIALIESGFSSTAHSSASAVGYWQFIKGTGKRYNLRIDNYMDERRDFVKSTQAAADYFKGLYNLFGAWYLAIASYNVGENRVKSLVMKNHTRDFWKLARENRLPDETSNYVPKFLAARLIAKDPEKYGFTDIEYMPPLAFAEVEFSTSIDIRKLAQGMNLEYDDLRDLNPSYKRGVAFHKAGKLTLRVPVGTETAAVTAAAGAAAGDTKIYVADEDYSYYRVRRGDTIQTIARKFNTSQGQIRDLNKLRRGATLVAGRRLRVPGEQVGGLEARAKKKSVTPVKETPAVQEPEIQLAKRDPASQASYKHPALKQNPKTRLYQNRKTASAIPKFHVVKRGESLTQIARRYGTSLKALAVHNNLNRKTKVVVGAKLALP